MNYDLTILLIYGSPIHPSICMYSEGITSKAVMAVACNSLQFAPKH